MIAEIGVDMSVFATPAHLASWAGVVGRELYNVTCPVVIADPVAYDALSDGDEVTVAATDDHATVRIHAPA